MANQFQDTSRSDRFFTEGLDELRQLCRQRCNKPFDGSVAVALHYQDGLITLVRSRHANLPSGIADLPTKICTNNEQKLAQALSEMRFQAQQKLGKRTFFGIMEMVVNFTGGMIVNYDSHTELTKK